MQLAKEDNYGFLQGSYWFGMALAMNPPALNAYSAMSEEQKQQILNKAHNARSEKEMHDIVNSMSAISH